MGPPHLAELLGVDIDMDILWWTMDDVHWTYNYILTKLQKHHVSYMRPRTVLRLK